MRYVRTYFLLAIGLILLGSFISPNTTESQEGWFLGHFKGTVDLGDGERPVFIHALGIDQNVKTIMDDTNGIGCEDSWDVTTDGPNSIMLIKTSDSCMPADQIQLVKTDEGIMTGNFYNDGDNASFAICVFERYAEAN